MHALFLQAFMATFLTCAYSAVPIYPSLSILTSDTERAQGVTGPKAI
jgi:hypothetical protein